MDKPWPANSSRAIDIQNSIRAFHSLNVKIHLHYFDAESKCCHTSVADFCTSVTSYKQQNAPNGISSSLPDFISSGYCEKLISNLNQDDHPVLFEGLHTTAVLKSICKNSRKISVRLHNNQAVYLRFLARYTLNPIKKIKFLTESFLTNRYIKSLPKDIFYACANESDCNCMKEHGFNNVLHIPVFGNWQKVNSPTGIGQLCLFYGDLSVAKNEHAALWLLCNVFNRVRVPFVIAGKNPSRRIKKAAELCQHTCLVSNPSEQELTDLIRKAHINILPSVNKNITGPRLKLLRALYEGRHCVVNPAMAKGTGLEDICHIGNNSAALAGIISQLYYQPFEEADIASRERLLEEKYDNNRNILKFKDHLW